MSDAPPPYTNQPQTGVPYPGGYAPPPQSKVQVAHGHAHVTGYPVHSGGQVRHCYNLTIRTVLQWKAFKLACVSTLYLRYHIITYIMYMYVLLVIHVISVMQNKFEFHI